MPGKSLDTDVPSAGSAAHHTAFAMRRGKFHQERLKMVLGYGSAVGSLEVLPEEQRKQAVPPAPMPLLTCASNDVRQH